MNVGFFVLSSVDEGTALSCGVCARADYNNTPENVHVKSKIKSYPGACIVNRY